MQAQKIVTKMYKIMKNLFKYSNLECIIIDLPRLALNVALFRNLLNKKRRIVLMHVKLHQEASVINGSKKCTDLLRRLRKRVNRPDEQHKSVLCGSELSSISAKMKTKNSPMYRSSGKVVVK